MRTVHNIKGHVISLCSQNVDLLDYFVNKELCRADVALIELIEQALKVLIATRDDLCKEITDDVREIYEQQFVVIEANGAIYDKSSESIDREKQALVVQVDSVKDRLIQELTSGINPLIKRVEALRELAVEKLSEQENKQIAERNKVVPVVPMYKAIIKLTPG